MLESEFQAIVIKELKEDILPGCEVLKNDAGYRPGVPDLIILFGERWGMLEVKQTIFASYRPNQEWYLDHYDKMSFATMICPENKEEVYRAIQQAFGN